MKTLKLYFLNALLFFVTVMPGCQQEEVETMNLQAGGIYKDPGPGPNPVTLPTVIKEEYPQATDWTITWEDTDFFDDELEKTPTYFSTQDGSIHSIYFLDNSDPQNTENADMSLLFKRITAPSLHYALENNDRLRSTQFKRSDMSASEMADYAENNPDLFQLAFETESYPVTKSQPVSLDPGEVPFYKTGDIYTFKTDRTPAKYGAIRIVKFSDPRIIEVVVQKGGIGGIISQ